MAKRTEKVDFLKGEFIAPESLQGCVLNYFCVLDEDYRVETAQNSFEDTMLVTLKSFSVTITAKKRLTENEHV